LDEYTADQLVRWYERLEKGVLVFGEHVPLTEANEALPVPVLASYLLDACGLIDSIFRDMTNDPAPLTRGPVPRSDCGIKDFAELHTKTMDLADTRSIMLISPPRCRSPFAPWKSTPYPDLAWWKAHNKLKHDRLANIHMSTLAATLDALCSLHQLISRRLEHVPILIKKGWFPRGHWPIDHVIKEAQKGKLPDAFVVQTALFATPTGVPRAMNPGEEQFPSDLKDLKLHYYQCNDDFYRFLGSTG
jgi:hypothetical protein